MEKVTTLGFPVEIKRGAEWPVNLYEMRQTASAKKKG